jgi:hypothetical protein
MPDRRAMSDEFEPCCEQMEAAVQQGFVLYLGGEHVLPPRNLTDIADATAGNVLTGETYDPADFALTLALEFCPWCGMKVCTACVDDEDDWLEEPPPRRPTEDTRPL